MAILPYYKFNSNFTFNFNCNDSILPKGLIDIKSHFFNPASFSE